MKQLSFIVIKIDFTYIHLNTVRNLIRRAQSVFGFYEYKFIIVGYTTIMDFWTSFVWSFDFNSSIHWDFVCSNLNTIIFTLRDWFFLTPRLTRNPASEKSDGMTLRGKKIIIIFKIIHGLLKLLKSSRKWFGHWLIRVVRRS